jgi:hypothetical protein
MGTFKFYLNYKMDGTHYTMRPNREPTPDGVTMRNGIPKWPAYTDEKKEFMAINKYWAVKNDYTKVIMEQRD